MMKNVSGNKKICLLKMKSELTADDIDLALSETLLERQKPHNMARINLRKMIDNELKI